jgi:aspartate aminotransferase-like enzyme
LKSAGLFPEAALRFFERVLTAFFSRRPSAASRNAFPERGLWSNTVSCISNTRGINVEQMLGKLSEKGYGISNGYGPLKEKTFRIGHLGDHTVGDLKKLPDTIDGVV